MKKSLALLLTVTSLLAIHQGRAVQAEENREYISTGSVEFTPSMDPTDPVNPTDPEQPIDPIDPTDPEGPDPGTAGPLSIDYASGLNFGKNQITSKDATYFAAAQRYRVVLENGQLSEPLEGPNYVQVTDNRGTESGWTLKVSQAGQFISEKGRQLMGASISFMNGEVVTISQSGKPNHEESFMLNPSGEESNVMIAPQGTGAGTHLLRMGKDAVTGKRSISLHVPGTTTKYAEKYSTKLVWALADIPSNG